MLTETMIAGGAELFALRLTDHLVRSGIECDLACLHPDLLDSRVAETRPSVPIIPVGVPWFPWVRRVDRVLRRLDQAPLQTMLTCRWIERHLPTFDVVHTHLFGADWIGAALKQRNPGLRLVSTLHGDYGSFDERRGSVSENSRLAHWPARRDRVLAAVDRYVYISAEQQAQFEGVYRVSEQKMVGIYNGVEPREEVAKAQGPGRPFVIAMAARGSIPEKGWRPLLEAFARLRGDVALHLIGDGPHLRALQQDHSADRRIKFLGFQADPAALIAQAQLFVLPTTYRAESLPTVVAEALSVGCPVIATDAGEIPAMLSSTKGPAGTVLEIASDVPLVEQLRGALQRYIDDQSLWERHAAAARLAFDRFDMARCTDRYRALYQSLGRVPASTASTRSNH